MADVDATEAVSRAVMHAELAALRSEHDELQIRTNELDRDVKQLDARVSDLRADVAAMEGQLGILVGAYERAANLAAKQAQADAEVRRSSTMAALSAGSSWRSNRQLVRLIAAVAGLVTAIATLLATGRC